ncbi:uncharacterized protein VP01_514g10 [Puccinia sorghi]|uniref:Uncharacterized protein n=1 Tax=Puccinia sorghi TaxID=27349 RepID=A0A0L6UMZ0_9BASI|nr:uncharacterized protein VP01_514g10 [Puccinia sorghi]
MTSNTGRLPILALAIVGKKGQPLYIRNFTSSSAWTSLMKEANALPTTLVDCYFGLLYAMEDYACYGYQSNTRIRFVLCLPMKDTLIKDTEVKLVSSLSLSQFHNTCLSSRTLLTIFSLLYAPIKVFKSLHAAYIQHICNPFYQIPLDNPNPNATTSTIKSKVFDQQISRIVGLS